MDILPEEVKLEMDVHHFIGSWRFLKSHKDSKLDGSQKNELKKIHDGLGALLDE